MLALRHDVTSVDDWAAAVGTAATHAGRLDVLVNNAGIMIKRGFLQTSLDDFRCQQRVNVESVFIGMQAALPLMQKTAKEHATTTSVINVSSVFGQVAGVDFSAYSATKGAVRLLTKAVAAEFAKAGVRVNSVHPGPTVTRLGADFEPPTDAQGHPLSAEESRAILEARIPAGRLGMPNDIAGAIAFLASDASRYVTGSELTVDGGYTTV